MVDNDDFLDAISLIDEIDNIDALEVVLDVLRTIFQEENKTALWKMLSSHQRHILSNGRNIFSNNAETTIN